MDELRKVALQKLEEAKLDRQKEREKILKQSNKLMFDLLSEYSERGEILSFKIEKLENK